MQLCLGSKTFECARYGTESPARFYDAASTLSPVSAPMARAPRFRAPAAHEATPAADYDHSTFLSASRAVAAGTTMPKAQRVPPPSTSLESPGAPAYLIKRDAAHYRYSTAGGRSMAARTDWAGGARGGDVPGPGAYDVATGISKPDVRACLAAPSRRAVYAEHPKMVHAVRQTELCNEVSRGTFVSRAQVSSASQRRPSGGYAAKRGARLR